MAEAVAQDDGPKTIEGNAVPTHCEYPECRKKLPKWKGGRGRPRRYCKGTKCAQRDYQRLHPRRPIFLPEGRA